MAIAAAAISTVASVAIAATCKVDACKGQISLLYTNANGPVYVNLAGGLSPASGCTLAGGIYYTLDMAQGNAKAIYAQLLAAQVSGTAVELVPVANSVGCIDRHYQLNCLVLDQDLGCERASLNCLVR